MRLVADDFRRPGDVATALMGAILGASGSFVIVEGIACAALFYLPGPTLEKRRLE
jgi:hypothetical protein